MKVITKYISREFIKLFILCQFIFILLFLVIDFIQGIDNFIEANVSIRNTLIYFLYEIPFITVQMIPVATIISAVTALCLMKKSREIIAMKACGLNILTVCKPLIVISILISISSFLLSEIIVPFTSSRNDKTWKIKIKKESPASFYGNTNIWYKSGNNIYWIKYFNVITKTMQDPVFYLFNNQFQLIKKIEAEKCVWKNGVWVVENGVMQTWKHDDTYRVSKFKSILFKIPETPATFTQRMKEPENMTYNQLKKHAEKVKAEGYDNTSDLVDLDFKLSFPLISAVFILIAVPIGLSKGITGIPLSVTIGISICFLFYVIMGFSRSLGLAGILPPLLAAWSPDVLFILIGTNLLMNVKK